MIDHALAEVIRKLQADHPAVIGLDLWRDVPVPKSGEQLPELEKVLTESTNVIGIFTTAGIAPPQVLMPYPDRLGFDDNFPFDVRVEKTIPKVRRCLLFEKSENGVRLDSFPFRIADAIVCENSWMVMSSERYLSLRRFSRFSSAQVASGTPPSPRERRS